MAGQGAPSIHEKAHAKINLYLHVTGRRDDGYHELETLFAFSNFGDRLTLAPSKALELRSTGSQGDELPDPEQNLVWQATQLLAKHIGQIPTGLITLEKNLPVAAGLGGGSADAAAVLRGLLRLWEVSLPEADLHQLALSLGADVPVCMKSESALAVGIGDQLAPVILPKCGVVLVNPLVGLETRDVFAAWRDSGGVFTTQQQPVNSLGSFPALLEVLHARSNDLEAPARTLLPAIDDVLMALQGLANCALARMSGSGASCFGLFETLGEAEAASVAIKAAHPEWWVQSSSLKDGVNASMGAT